MGRLWGSQYGHMISELALKAMDTCNMLKPNANDMKVKEDYSCPDHLTPKSDGDICFIQQLIVEKKTFFFFFFLYPLFR